MVVIDSFDVVKIGFEILCIVGMGFVFDDFGIGYFSFGYFYWLLINCIKIDKSFVVGVYEFMVCGIVILIFNLCCMMKLFCVVEGVEMED